MRLPFDPGIPAETEEVDAKSYLDLDDARRRIGAFIETACSKKRLHSALGYKPRSSLKPNSAGTNCNKANQDEALSVN